MGKAKKSQEDQIRRWNITLNNPANHGMDADAFEEAIVGNRKVKYFCMVEEIGEEGTVHYHAYVEYFSGVRFSTLKNHLPAAHIEKALGKAIENRDYMLHVGTHEDKGGEYVAHSFREFGDLPSSNNNSASSDDIMALLKAGKTTQEIIEEKPSALNRYRVIQTIEQDMLRSKYGNCTRKVECTYIYGATGAGKTYGIFHKYGYGNVCRITNYNNDGKNFDNYNRQEVLMLDEFHSQIPITTMLNVIGEFPCDLPARYGDRTACYNKVFIVSNIPLEKQFVSIQKGDISTWKAFLRRIKEVIEYTESGEIIHRIITNVGNGGSIEYEEKKRRQNNYYLKHRPWS